MFNLFKTLLLLSFSMLGATFALSQVNETEIEELEATDEDQDEDEAESSSEERQTYIDQVESILLEAHFTQLEHKNLQELNKEKFGPWTGLHMGEHLDAAKNATRDTRDALAKILDLDTPEDAENFEQSVENGEMR